MTDDKTPPITSDDKVAIEDSPGALAFPSSEIEPERPPEPKVEAPAPVQAAAPSPKSGLESLNPPPSAWSPAPLEPRPPLRPPEAAVAAPVAPQAPVQTYDAPPPVQTFDARDLHPLLHAAVREHVDPDHFAIAETDDGADTVLDRSFGWVGRLVGDRAELDESSAARAERALGWTSRTILIAVLLMLIFNAKSLPSWASTLPPQWGTETLRLVTGEWAGRLQDGGFDEPRRRTHAAYETSKTLDWKGAVRPQH
jgi:hypothetical protein